MDIKLSILEPKKGQYIKPIEYEYHGNYALETMFFRVGEIYFGQEISKQIEVIILRRIS